MDSSDPLTDLHRILNVRINFIIVETYNHLDTSTYVGHTVVKASSDFEASQRPPHSIFRSFLDLSQ